jgi:hypothetical protein
MAKMANLESIDHTVLYGTDLFRAAFLAVNCQATIIQSLRDAHVILMADGPARHLYSQFGFKPIRAGKSEFK